MLGADGAQMRKCWKSNCFTTISWRDKRARVSQPNDKPSEPDHFGTALRCKKMWLLIKSALWLYTEVCLLLESFSDKSWKQIRKIMDSLEVEQILKKYVLVLPLFLEGSRGARVRKYLNRTKSRASRSGREGVGGDWFGGFGMFGGIGVGSKHLRTYVHA